MKILVLGAAGFIGSHLTERLLRESQSIVAVDIYNDKIQEFLTHDDLDFRREDIRDPNFNLEEHVEASDLVIDLIAYANPGLYVKFPAEVFHLNFIENLKIANACLKYKKRLIQFSSCEVYGKTVSSLGDIGLANPEDPAHATFQEDVSSFILGPVNKHRWIYACAKQLLERVLHAYGLQYNFNYSIIRPFNFIGPKIDYLLDETDGAPRVFSYFMDALIKGTDMQLVDGGDQRRCYTYIQDAIECIWRIIQNPRNVCDRQILNVGSPHNEISMKEMAYQMRDIYAEQFRDRNIPLSNIIVVSGEAFYGIGYEDSDRRIPDISKVRSLLNWEPQWNIQGMLVETMKYYVSDYQQHFRAANKSGQFQHDIVNRMVSGNKSNA